MTCYTATFGTTRCVIVVERLDASFISTLELVEDGQRYLLMSGDQLLEFVASEEQAAIDAATAWLSRTYGHLDDVLKAYPEPGVDWPELRQVPERRS